MDRPPAWSGAQFEGNADVLVHYALVHLRISGLALGLGLAVAVPIAVATYRRRTAASIVLGVTSVAYTIPSLALLLIIGAAMGSLLSDWPLVFTLAIYTLVILVRNLIEGLRAVPASSLDAAVAMGMTPTRRLLQVEFPLALPAAIAGLRIAAVSTISLVTVGGIIGRGGLGFLIQEGYRKDNPRETIAALVATVVLALAADAVVVVTGRMLTPWERTSPRVRRRRTGLAGGGETAP